VWSAGWETLDVVYFRATWYTLQYGVATISRLLKIKGLVCKRALGKRLYSAKETINFKETTNLRHPIPVYCVPNTTFTPARKHAHTYTYTHIPPQT